MVAFDNIEDIFQNIRGLNEYFKALVTLSTVVGVFIVIFYTIKTIFNLIQCLRLYLFSQMCCRPDFIKKYGQWAVITGSTDGIGLAMARDLARRGMSIIVIGRNEEKLADTKLSLENEPNVGDIITVKIDLSDSSTENFERIKSQIDPENRDIGILINNVGISPAKLQRYNNYDMSYIQSMVNLNILATLYMTRIIMPGMVNRGKGLIVNVSSVFESIPASYLCIYGPTKAFIKSFSRQLQIEYSSHPIDIINLTPGAVHTNLFKSTAIISRPTPLNPSAEDFAKSAINAIGTGINQISGTFMHALTYEFAKFYAKVNLLSPLMMLNMKLFAKDLQLSPIPKRKLQAQAVTVNN